MKLVRPRKRPKPDVVFLLGLLLENAAGPRSPTMISSSALAKLAGFSTAKTKQLLSLMHDEGYIEVTPRFAKTEDASKTPTV